MDSPSRTTNQETPLPSMSFVFPLYGDVGPPLMAMLSLPRLTIRLPIWLFSSLVIPCTPAASDPNPSSQEHQPHVDPSPSSPDVSSPISTSSPIESCSTSIQVDKKKKKRNIKKKKNKQTTKSQPITPPSADSVDMHTQIPGKPKFPCRLCKGDHLLKYFHGLNLVLEEWSKVSWKLMSSAFVHYIDDPPSTSDSMVKSQKCKVRNHCFLCKDMHFTYLCPLMDEASKLLEYITSSHQ